MKSSKRRDWKTVGRWQKQNYIEQRTGGKCECCGELFPNDMLDFHHRVSEAKLFHVSGGEWMKLTITPRVLQEAQKCVILCKNCHALEHVAMKKNESVIYDKAAYSRFRDYRVEEPEGINNTHDRDEGPTDGT